MANLSCCETQTWVPLGLSEKQGLVSCFSETITKKSSFLWTRAYPDILSKPYLNPASYISCCQAPLLVHTPHSHNRYCKLVISHVYQNKSNSICSFSKPTYSHIALFICFGFGFVWSLWYLIIAVQWWSWCNKPGLPCDVTWIWISLCISVYPPLLWMCG